MKSLEGEFKSEVQNLQTAFGGINQLKQDVGGLNEKLELHTQAFAEIAKAPITAPPAPAPAPVPSPTKDAKTEERLQKLLQDVTDLGQITQDTQKMIT